MTHDQINFYLRHVRVDKSFPLEYEAATADTCKIPPMMSNNERLLNAWKLAEHRAKGIKPKRKIIKKLEKTE